MPLAPPAAPTAPLAVSPSAAATDSTPSAALRAAAERSEGFTVDPQPASATHAASVATQVRDRAGIRAIVPNPTVSEAAGVRRRARTAPPPLGASHRRAVRSRRMPGDLAFGHCWAVLDDGAVAAEAAIAALRRAGRSRSSILAHARYQALLQPEPSPPSADVTAPDDLSELARLLAMTRPARERAVLDLRARLDRADLGRALGMRADVAAALADGIGESWDRVLDPQLIVSLGPGDCPDLAAVLADLEHSTLGDLAAAAPSVASHIDSCDVCADRRRAMVSVRALFAQASPPEAPPAVREAARRARRMRPAPAPPPFEPRRRRPLVVAAAIIAGLAIIGGATATAAALTRPNRGRAHRVAKLVHVPPTARLGVAAVGNAIEVTNRSTRVVTFHARADVEWLQLRPSTGTIAPGAVFAVRSRVLPSSPEGMLRATVTVTGDDGSAAATVLETNVERAPDLAASADGCAVTAMVEDNSGIAAVSLHWNDRAGSHDLPMSAAAAGYAGTLPSGAPLTWWVSAADSRGNDARTPDAQLIC
jgi:hypothetical protein